MGIAFTQTALVVLASDVTNNAMSLSLTAFCPRDHHRTYAPHPTLPLPYHCVPCPAGHRSFGGMAHSCLPCQNRMCVETEVQLATHTNMTHANVTVLLDASAHVEHGENFSIQVLAHTGTEAEAAVAEDDSGDDGLATGGAAAAGTAAAGSAGGLELVEPCASTESQTVMLDVTPPNTTEVNDALPCCCNSSCVAETTDVEHLGETQEIAAWWTPSSTMRPASQAIITVSARRHTFVMSSR